MKLVDLICKNRIHYYTFTLYLPRVILSTGDTSSNIPRIPIIYVILHKEYTSRFFMFNTVW